MNKFSPAFPFLPHTMTQVTQGWKRISYTCLFGSTQAPISWHSL